MTAAAARRVSERRSHAERSATTRAKIVAAVVDSIAEVGFQRTTAIEITRRSGVTWGAVQHHFGGKDGLLIAVVEDSFARFAARTRDIRRAGTPLVDRVSLFVDRAWAHYRSRHYRAAFEILLHALRGNGRPRNGDWRLRMSRALDGVWSRIFADAALARERSRLLQHYTVSTLSGLAATLMLQERGAVLPKPELDLLKDTLRRELAGAARGARRRGHG